jgi:hypothetical protein
MNPDRPTPPTDDEIDRLLASRFKDTTPEFERRWIDLKRELRTAPRRRPLVPAWAAWLGLASAGVAVMAILFLQHPGRRSGSPSASEPSPALAELFAMDAVLSRATPLLDAENRDVLLHLPAQPASQI